MTSYVLKKSQLFINSCCVVLARIIDTARFGFYIARIQQVFNRSRMVFFYSNLSINIDFIGLLTNTVSRSPPGH